MNGDCHRSKNPSDRKFFSLCNDCDMAGKPNIRFLSMATKRVIKRQSEETSLFFLTDGQVEVSCGTATRVVEKGYFFLIPAGEHYEIRSTEETRLAACYLEEKLLVRHKCREGLLYDIYGMKIQEKDCGLFSVKTNRYVRLLLNDCEEVTNSDFVCARYMQYKTEELLILLRSYYPDELLARLFYPAFNVKIDFHRVITTNRDKFFTVEEYAAATNLDRNTFLQKFKETYGRNPNEWIKQERIKQVFRDLVEGDMSITDIVNHYRFSNLPNFIRFCRVHYKNTPGNIHKIMGKTSC